MFLVVMTETKDIYTLNRLHSTVQKLSNVYRSLLCIVSRAINVTYSENLTPYPYLV